MNTANIRKIFEYIFKNKEVERENIVKEFGKESYEHFERYAYNVHPPFVSDKGKGVKLTSFGLQELWRMKEEQSRKNQTYIMVVATIILAASSFFQAHAIVWGSPSTQDLYSFMITKIQEGGYILVTISIFIVFAYVMIHIAETLKDIAIKFTKKKRGRI